MRASLQLAALLALLAIATQVDAQSGGAPATTRPAAAPSGTNVALVDISHIFKNCARIKQSFEGLQKQVEELQAEARAKEAALNKMKEEMQGLKPNSPEFKERDEAIVKEATEFQIQMRKRQTELSEQEARLYYDSYKEIEARIAEFCARRRIGLVLRYSRDKMSPDDANSIKMGLGKMVVWHSGLDITLFILEAMNSVEPTTPTGDAPAAAPTGGTARKNPATKAR